jgi:Ran GTPase-activating protein (RanGAP) involved in mRNA processing and transport
MTAAAASLLADALRGVALSDPGPVDDPATTESESDWSDAELREADSHGNGAPPSAAQGSGRPWAHVSRARRGRREAKAREAQMRFQGAVAAAGGDAEGSGVFLGDLDASAAIHVLSHLSPVDRARVAACRRSERAALTSPGSAHTTPRSSNTTTPVGSPFSVSPAGRGLLAARARRSSNLGGSADRGAIGPSLGAGALDDDAAGHLADAAWREVDLRGAATPAALTTLRSVACGALRRLDVTGSRGLRRGEILELARESPQLRTLRAASLGDTGKFSARDCDLVFAACPSLETFECDVGVSAAKVKVEGEYVRGTAERDVAELLAKPQTRVRRMKIHSADAESASEIAVAVAIAAADDRVRSLDVSWGLKLSDGAATGVAEAMERHGRGVPLRRLAMRKANVHDEGAIAIAGCIARAADAVAKHEAAVAEAARFRAKGEDGHGDDRAPVTPEHRKPLCRLRWLDLGSNMIGDRGAVAIGDALGPNVPITRLNLRDNAVGMHGCAALGRAVARCVTLRRLDLAHSGFGDAGATALARGFATAAAAGRSTSLRVLQLGFNSIGVEGIKALVEAHAAGALDELEHLDLACNVMGPAGAAALAPMLEPRDDRFVEVEDEVAGRLEHEHEGEAEVDDVPRGRGLYSLDVAVNNCAADGDREGVRALMRALERNTTLRVLNLRGNDLTPEIAGDVAEMLLENETLRVVNVGYNKIYNEGAWELAEALSENAGLRGLDIQRNEISDEGGAHVRGLLEANEKLSEVDMRSNMLSPEVVDEFGKVFGERVNCRWQQEPPKKDRKGVAQSKMVAEGGGGVAAKRAERARKKAAARAARGG